MTIAQWLALIVAVVASVAGTLSAALTFGAGPDDVIFAIPIGAGVHTTVFPLTGHMAVANLWGAALVSGFVFWRSRPKATPCFVASGDGLVDDLPLQGSLMADNAGIVHGIYEAFGRGDVPGVLGAFDPKIEWKEAEGFKYAAGNPYVGPMAVAQGVFQPIVTESDGFTVTPERYVAGGDSVVVEGRYRCTVKATGKPVNAQFAHIWTLSGGKVVRFQQYTDTGQWAAAFGD